MSIEVVGLLVFTVYIIISAVFQIESKAANVAVVVGLVLLVAGATSLNIWEEAIVNQLAMYSFFFLASGVVLLFIQHVREGH